MSNNALGKAKARRYDLPFQKDIGTRYMTTVIGLMVFLGFLSVALSLALNALSERWTTGLEGKMTIEIPAQDIDLQIREKDTLNAIAKTMIEALNKRDNVESATIVEDDTLINMISPWIDVEKGFNDLPLPILVSVVFDKAPQEQEILDLQNYVVSVDGASHLDTHQDWLNELLRFTGALKLITWVMGLVITITTLMAVAGVVRARLAAHMSDVELLHLMGATDPYIARQFQGHILTLAFKGCLVGGILGLGMIKSIGLVSGHLGLSLLPDFSFTMQSWVILMIVPFFILGLSFLTARTTILNALKLMP